VTKATKQSSKPDFPKTISNTTIRIQAIDYNLSTYQHLFPRKYAQTVAWLKKSDKYKLNSASPSASVPSTAASATHPPNKRKIGNTNAANANHDISSHQLIPPRWHHVVYFSIPVAGNSKRQCFLRYPWHCGEITNKAEEWLATLKAISNEIDNNPNYFRKKNDDDDDDDDNDDDEEEEDNGAGVGVGVVGVDKQGDDADEFVANVPVNNAFAALRQQQDVDQEHPARNHSKKRKTKDLNDIAAAVHNGNIAKSTSNNNNQHHNVNKNKRRKKGTDNGADASNNNASNVPSTHPSAARPAADAIAIPVAEVSALYAAAIVAAPPIATATGSSAIAGVPAAAASTVAQGPSDVIPAVAHVGGSIDRDGDAVANNARIAVADPSAVAHVAVAGADPAAGAASAILPPTNNDNLIERKKLVRIGKQKKKANKLAKEKKIWERKTRQKQEKNDNNYHSPIRARRSLSLTLEEELEAIAKEIQPGKDKRMVKRRRRRRRRRRKKPTEGRPRDNSNSTVQPITTTTTPTTTTTTTTMMSLLTLLRLPLLMFLLVTILPTTITITK
jgi:hypothetical protein